MKVLLISTNQLRPSEECSWIPVEPLGLAYLAASVRRAGHDAFLLDLCFSPDSVAAVGDEIRRVDPDMIGISFRNVEMMAYFRNTSFGEGLRSIVACCREHSGAPIVLGGSGFSVMPHQLMRLTGADIGVVGEGEWNFPALLEALEAGTDIGGIPGTIRMVGRDLRFNPPDHTGDINSLPLPDRKWIDHRRYIEAGGSANIQTKRGCPFNCIYCTYPLVEGSRMRCRHPEEVAVEFRMLSERYGVTDVYVVDNQFNHPIDHAKAVCTEWLAMRDEVKIWWTCMLNPGYIDDDPGIASKPATGEEIYQILQCR